METVFSKFIGQKVKACFSDEGRTKVVYGILNEVNENYIVIDSVIIGLGTNFISCIPQEGNNNARLP